MFNRSPCRAIKPIISSISVGTPRAMSSAIEPACLDLGISLTQDLGDEFYRRKREAAASARTTAMHSVDPRPSNSSIMSCARRMDEMAKFLSTRARSAG